MKCRYAPLERAKCAPRTHHWGGQAAPGRTPTTSFLTATTLIYAIGAGITAAAGTRLALQSILIKGFKFYSFQLQDGFAYVLLFLVTTSLCQDWVICAPAAFLRCASRFSGCLSGIEPWFPVTRQNHCGRLCHSRQLIGHTFEGYVVSARLYDQPKVIQSHQKLQPKPIGFDLIKAILT